MSGAGGHLPLQGTDFEADILPWRESALGYVLWGGLGIATVPLFIVFFITPESDPLGMRLPSLWIFFLTAVIAIARRAPYRVRCSGFLLVILALGAVMLAGRGLESGGRLVLAVVPLYATVFLGLRAGYLAVPASFATFAGVAFLDASGLFGARSPGGAEAQPLQFWLLQGAILALVMLPVTFLVGRFVALLQATLASERVAAALIAEAGREQRRLERVLLETSERERRAVGHLLHDGPCQEITAALMRCKVLERSLEASGAPGEVAHVRAVAELLDTSAGAIHDLARGLNPPGLAPGALAGALEDLARRTRAAAGVACELRQDPTAQPDGPETSDHLFRIAQEAVMNATRHASPSRIEIALARRGDEILLSVRDDGAGVPRERRPEGLGLRIMRHRAELIGGALSVAPAAGGGTVVTCTVPLLAPEGSVRERV
jgi:signal transduction histidine kinase